MPATVKYSALGLPTPSIGGGGGNWGSILGNIADQTDLQSALGLLAPKADPTFTGTLSLGAGGVAIPSGAPGVVTNKLYQVGGSLYFNGAQLAAGAGITLSSALTGFVLGTDGTALSATDTVLQAFQKLQVRVNAGSGSSAMTGAVVIDFGAYPGSNEASVVVTGQSGITALSKVDAFFVAVATADHSINDHTYAPLFIYLTAGSLVAGTGFTIYARSPEKMSGTYNLNWTAN